ncbi:MAG: helix-turn-helix transcriptional regulator [Saprospiraceae bacterium]|uniref:Helix-turn-helix transcriptional regulator n=1 Tax=Candidatus Opimibacter skivensis TaxID=2982028 RepID=A0A9D7SXJ5_9BACT|nr:helix-turn-helix transcriptional regulator [Candidatus Opimibacter skivensis]
MLSTRCKMAVKTELRKLGLHFVFVDLGEVEIMENISEEVKEQLRVALHLSGFELMDDKKSVLVQKIKNVIHDMVYHSDEIIKKNFSEFLSEKLTLDYTFLSNLFSAMQGTTIEQYLITHKIERIKDLMIYGDLNMTEISWKMNYSSVAHLSTQFKKVTGLSPTHFKKMKELRENAIEETVI